MTDDQQRPLYILCKDFAEFIYLVRPIEYSSKIHFVGTGRELFGAHHFDYIITSQFWFRTPFRDVSHILEILRSRIDAVDIGDISQYVAKYQYPGRAPHHA